MGRLKTFALVSGAALAVAGGAAARDSATTRGSTEIQGKGGIEATGQVIFENLTIPTIPLSPLITASSVDTANVSLPGGASVVSLAVPQTVDVTGENESFTVLTELGGGQVGLYGMESLIASGGTLSVDIGGAITIRPEDLAPGEYRGLLVVVAQYN